MKKRAGRKKYLKRIAVALSAFLLALFIPVTALADGDFSGDIIITKTVEGYEYKVYEVLDCIGAGGDDSIFMASESWKEFLKTNENALAMLIPRENDGNYPMADEDSDLYMVNVEFDKEVRQNFAADVLEYAKANGLEAYECITADGEEDKVIFEYLPLGIYVVDTAGKARITVMWDMEWVSKIEETYTEETEEDPSVETSTGETETAEESASAQAEAVMEEPHEEADAVQEDGEYGEEATPTASSTEIEASTGSSNIAAIVAVVVLVLAISGVIVIRRRKNKKAGR